MYTWETVTTEPAEGQREIWGRAGAAAIVGGRPTGLGRGLGAPPDDERLEACPVANIKSQIKRIKTNEAARQRNKATKSALKTSVRRFREAADAGDAAKASELAQAASRALDKAASKGVIHKNQAANRKSAIAAKAARV
jgi:small subunit ribosomal protein S20